MDIDSLFNIMEGLHECDGVFKAILINDEEIKEFLEKLNVITTGNRGSSYQSKNYDKFKEFMYEMLNYCES